MLTARTSSCLFDWPILSERQGLAFANIKARRGGCVIDRVVAGPERKSKVISDKEKRITAFHEAGHALVGHFMGDMDPVHKISIIPRGRMGGYTRFLPPEDRSLMSQSQFEDQIATFSFAAMP